MEEWNPKELLITEECTEEFFRQTGKEQCCDEVQKMIIDLLEKGTHLYEIKNKIEETGKDVALCDIVALDKKRHEMRWNHNIAQYSSEQIKDENRQRELIKELSKEREEINRVYNKNAKTHYIKNPFDNIEKDDMFMGNDWERSTLS